MKDLKIESNPAHMIFDGHTYEGDLFVEVDHTYSEEINVFLNREQAEQIVNHLIKVFDITYRDNDNE